MPAPPFPEVFVINLDGRTDRWAAIVELCGATGITPNRIPGVRTSPGWRGCGFAHLQCIHLARMLRLPWVLILEDDATFTPESIDRFKQLLPYLWENRDKWERFNGGPTFPRNPVITPLNKERHLVYAKGFTTHFHLIHAGAYDRILQWNPDCDRMLDVFFMDKADEIRSIATHPHISTQIDSQSDITPGLSYGRLFLYSNTKIREFLESQADIEESSEIGICGFEDEAAPHGADSV